MTHLARFNPTSLDDDSRISVVLGATVVGVYLLLYVFGAIRLDSIDALVEPVYPETALLILPGFLAGVGVFVIHAHRHTVHERHEWRRTVRLFTTVGIVTALGVYSISVAIIVLDSWVVAATLVPLSTILYLSYLAVLVLLAGVLGVAIGISGLFGYYVTGGVATAFHHIVE